MPGDYLLYDGECPACRSYVAMARLRRQRPDLKILDGRKQPDLVADLRRRGYEVNEGMVLSLDGQLYFGPEATRMIALIGRDSWPCAPTSRSLPSARHLGRAVSTRSSTAAASSC